MLSRPIGKHLTPLVKFAWFDGADDPARIDRWRLWLQLTFRY